ncbi:hypothetical protein [uncultured Tateyamaria sp.]|uniref:hypothetical protein n=1 Tax=uncultured Tateyamaria sp. TaxID=455651 RepID=UPI00262BB65E|nr:hypothetical protein [uncultured Tateyamaria sp.]
MSEKTGSQDDDDLEYGPVISLPKKIGAPTTHKRVGRSMRRPPGPSLDDGPGDSAVSTEETPEDLGTALIESIRDILKTRKGLEDLGTGLDGRSAADRSVEELERLDRIGTQLKEERTFEAKIFAVPCGRKNRLCFADGQSVEVSLVPRQRTVWVSIGHNRAIAVASDLPVYTRTDEALRTLSDEVEAVAAENCVAIRPGGVLAWFREVALRLENRFGQPPTL